jgi:hypothetical protein
MNQPPLDEQGMPSKIHERSERTEVPAKNSHDFLETRSEIIALTSTFLHKRNLFSSISI